MSRVVALILCFFYSQYADCYFQINNTEYSYGNFIAIEGKKVNEEIKVLGRESVRKSSECILKCITTQHCKSVNVIEESEGKFICEVLKTNRFKSSDKFVDNPMSTHITIVNPCLQNPCVNGGTCLYQSFNDYRCTCPIEFTGRNCETDTKCSKAISKGRPTAQSSNFYMHALRYHLTPGLAVDGNENGNIYQGSCTATNSENNPWWRVDLGRSCFVTNVRISNRNDCCFPENFELRVGDGLSDNGNTNPMCGAKTHAGGAGIRTYSCDLMGRFVNIRIPRYSQLNLCELTVNP